MEAQLSRRERQVMDIVYRLGKVSVSDVHQAMSDAPSYSAVRALMGTLVDKEHLAHERDGRRYLYFARVPVEQASASALQRVITNFFSGSAVDAAVALVSEGLDDHELDALEAAIARAREDGR